MTEREEEYSIYRLGATIYGCMHFEHLVEQVSGQGYICFLYVDG